MTVDQPGHARFAADARRTDRAWYAHAHRVRHAGRGVLREPGAPAGTPGHAAVPAQLGHGWAPPRGAAAAPPRPPSGPERAGAALRFTVLGELSAQVGGRPVALGPLKQRLVLALLLCRAGSPVSVDLLTETVWQDEPPRTARKNLQVYVSALRKLLAGPDGDGAPCLESLPTGYLLRLGPGELDLLRYRALVRDGRAAAARGESAVAARTLREALDLWRGVPLSELHFSQPLHAESRRLDDDRVGVYEDWAEAELRLGEARTVADRIAGVAARHPLRERLQAVRMGALHRAGRRAEALAVYEDIRQRLARELGLTPGAQLESLYRSILAEEPAAPPLRRPAQAGALLPPDLPDFTGRDEESALLTGVLGDPRDGRSVLLVGPCGAGKTALAVHGAHRLGGRFPDGRLLVGLRTADGRPRPQAEVLDEIVRSAGLALRAPADPAQAAALCRAWFAERRVLLVLDDVPDESLARTLLPGGGRSRLLLTSRAQLAGLTGVERIELPAATAAQALDLLGRVIGQGRLARDPAAARRIVMACGMLPLAVRVAGLRLAVLRHLPLAEFAARLSEPAATLRELTAGDVAVGPRLAMCWRDLAGAERGTLLRLAGLPPGVPFTLGQAACALGCGAGEAQHRLEGLIEAGAVNCPPEEAAAQVARFTVPRLLHLYARERRAA